jgi:hypothetical protein
MPAFESGILRCPKASDRWEEVLTHPGQTTAA